MRSGVAQKLGMETAAEINKAAKDHFTACTHTPGQNGFCMSRGSADTDGVALLRTLVESGSCVGVVEKTFIYQR